METCEIQFAKVSRVVHVFKEQINVLRSANTWKKKKEKDKKTKVLIFFSYYFSSMKLYECLNV